MTNNFINCLSSKIICISFFLFALAYFNQHWPCHTIIIYQRSIKATILLSGFHLYTLAHLLFNRHSAGDLRYTNLPQALGQKERGVGFCQRLIHFNILFAYWFCHIQLILDIRANFLCVDIKGERKFLCDNLLYFFKDLCIIGANPLCIIF